MSLIVAVESIEPVALPALSLAARVTITVSAPNSVKLSAKAVTVYVAVLF